MEKTLNYNYFINDTANLDLGIGAEFEPITGLTAEQAAVKYAELKDKGLSPYIGLNIPGDIVFDDKDGQGAGIFAEVEGKPSFYIGDNFVKQLKENNEHSQNVIAAYKELYETADKYILGIEKPSFVYEKEEELNSISQLYDEKVKELEQQGFSLKEYGELKYSHFEQAQYAIYSDGKKEITLNYEMERIEGEKDIWKAGKIFETFEVEISPELNILRPYINASNEDLIAYQKQYLSNQKQSEVSEEMYNQIQKEFDYRLQEQKESMSHSNSWSKDFSPVYYHALYYGDSVNGKNYKDNIQTALLVGKAKRGDVEAAAQLINESIQNDVIVELKEKYPDAIVCAVDGLESSGHNRIPLIYRDFLAEQGFAIDNQIVQNAKAHHTGADSLDKLLNRVRFTGEVQREKDYILLDDHISSGSTLRDLKDYIESNGGNVVAITTLTADHENYKIQVSEENLKKLNSYGEKLDELLKEYGITDNKSGLTDKEASEIISLLSDGRRSSEIEGGFRKGFLESLNSIQENYLSNQVNYPPLRVYTFSPFGYEGTIVQVETYLRRGIPAYDIVGIADSAVKETRERVRAAFTNSELEFPSERVLQSLSPADLRKDSPMDLSMALGILGTSKQYPVSEPVLALGELELSGRIRPVRGAVAAVNSAKAAGITNIVCDPTTAELLKNIDGISILTAENLKEADEKLMSPDLFAVKTEPKLYKAETVQFNEEWMEDYKEALENLPMDGHFETIRAIEIAVAGKHNILATGAPGCGKTLLTQTLMPALTPKMTEEESQSITRINSLAGLDSPKRDKLVPPFRMPHQTATIEGICGGGPNCRPGEISLAHQGTLFMDETAEFRSSVIQMLRVPLESRQITLSRAGRSTSYPADFQLAMAMNPCPCGNFHSPDKICLDSARTIEQYWKKISDPLLDRVEIKTFVQKDEKDTRKMSIDELKAQIATAYEIQRKRGVYNSHMTPEEIQRYCKLDKEGQAYLDKEEEKLTPRGKSNLLKLSLTIANMDGREEIHINDLMEARELSAPVFEKPRKYTYDPSQAAAVIPFVKSSKELEWKEIESLFKIDDWMEFDDVRKEIERLSNESSNILSETELKKKTIERVLWHTIVESRNYIGSTEKVIGPEYVSLMKDKCSKLSEETALMILSGKITSFNEGRDYFTDKIEKTDVYIKYKEVFNKELEEYLKGAHDFYVDDTANLELGIGAEFEPITHLSAEQAAVKYAELKNKGLSPYIGLCIYRDNVFYNKNKKGFGAGIFCETEGKHSFFIGNNFVKELKENDEHAKTVIAAYKELYETADKYIPDIEKPSFVYEKEDELEAMERANGLREMEADFDDTGLTPEQKEIRIAQSKFGDIIRESFLALTDEEKENGTTVEQKNTRYENWFRPMVDEIMADIGNGNKEVMAIIQNFDFNHESHVQGNKWYSADEAYRRDVQYKLLPEMYEKVQDRIKAEYEEKKIPYVVMYSSESPKFPSENKVYTVKEFNELILQADSEFYNRKKYAEQKYGSADNYWDLERDDKLPEEDKGIQFGYDKTNFKFFNIPNPNNPEDTFSYEPSRYDIGDGNGSVFDYVRSTCSHDEFIEALNLLETQLYFPGVAESQRQFVEKTVEEETQVLKNTLKERMEALDKAQNEYKELHKKWLIEATEADRVDEMLKHALEGIKDAYDTSMNDVFTKVLNEYPFASGDVSGSEFLKYTANEVKKMVVSELYLPSRDAQKAMNAEDYKTYNSIDWAKLRRIWEKFPVNVNMTAYTENLLQEKCEEKGISVQIQSRAVTPPSPTKEEIEEGHNLVREVRAENVRKQYKSEQGSNYDSNLSTTEIAKKLREYIKVNYPGYKFSVRSEYFSGGPSISVELKKTPVEIATFETMKEYCEKYPSTERYNYEKQKYEKYNELSPEEKTVFINKILESPSFYNVNRYHFETMDYMNPEVKAVFSDVISQLESYNYDHSDSQTDYFDVNFYSNYDISSEAVTHSLEIIANKAAGITTEKSSEEEIGAATKAEIVMNEKYNMPNLSFDGKPDEQMREKLKAEGWLWNGKDSVWWPRTKEAQANAQKFAETVVNSFLNVENQNINLNPSDLVKNAEENYKAVIDEYHLTYDFLYETSDQNVINKQNYAMDIYDYAMKQNGEFANIVRMLAEKRGDIFSSDRECAAIVFALNNAGYLKQIEETKDFEIEDILKDTAPEEKKSMASQSFFDDAEKMRDFFEITKEEFLSSYSYLTEEEYDATFEEVIHSESFISRFGDWEKAQRLEKLKIAESLETDGKIILNSEDLTNVVVSLIENEDRKSIQSLEKEIGGTVVGKYVNLDSGLTFNVSNRNVTEISNHHYLWKEHIKSISLIPQISEKAIYIGEEENEDKKRNPNIVTYKYFAAGIKIDNEDYTCKVVIGVDENKNCYYDQSLSTIEKGKLVDILQEKNKLEADNLELTKEENNNLSPLITQREVTSSYVYYDKRLINICQVPQMPYLDENLKPTFAAVQAVQKGILYVEKKGQQYVITNLKEKSVNKTDIDNTLSWTSLHNGRDTDYTNYNGHSIERYFAGKDKNNENSYSVTIDGKHLVFLDEETNEERELFFTESELNKQILNDTLYYGNSMDTLSENTNTTELSPEDIEICKKVIPPSQFKFTMELTEGEEGEFFKNKMKEISDTYRRINVDNELINEDGTHTVGFRYFLGDTEIFLSEIDSDGIGFGYNILNGDLEMSEWGSTSLEEILSIPYMEMDYHVPKGATIEQMLYKEYPDYFSEYASVEKTENKAASIFSKYLDELKKALPENNNNPFEAMIAVNLDWDNNGLTEDRKLVNEHFKEIGCTSKEAFNNFFIENFNLTVKPSPKEKDITKKNDKSSQDDDFGL